MWGRLPRRLAGFHAGLSSQGQKPVGTPGSRQNCWTRPAAAEK